MARFVSLFVLKTLVALFFIVSLLTFVEANNSQDFSCPSGFSVYQLDGQNICVPSENYDDMIQKFTTPPESKQTDLPVSNKDAEIPDFFEGIGPAFSPKTRSQRVLSGFQFNLVDPSGKIIGFTDSSSYVAQLSEQFEPYVNFISNYTAYSLLSDFIYSADENAQLMWQYLVWPIVVQIIGHFLKIPMLSVILYTFSYFIINFGSEDLHVILNVAMFSLQIFLVAVTDKTTPEMGYSLYFSLILSSFFLYCYSIIGFSYIGVITLILAFIFPLVVIYAGIQYAKFPRNYEKVVLSCLLFVLFYFLLLVHGDHLVRIAIQHNAKDFILMSLAFLYFFFGTITANASLLKVCLRLVVFVAVRRYCTRNICDPLIPNPELDRYVEKFVKDTFVSFSIISAFVFIMYIYLLGIASSHMSKKKMSRRPGANVEEFNVYFFLGCERFIFAWADFSYDVRNPWSFVIFIGWILKLSLFLGNAYLIILALFIVTMVWLLMLRQISYTDIENYEFSTEAKVSHITDVIDFDKITSISSNLKPHIISHFKEGLNRNLKGWLISPKMVMVRKKTLDPELTNAQPESLEFDGASHPVNNVMFFPKHRKTDGIAIVVLRDTTLPYIQTVETTKRYSGSLWIPSLINSCWKRIESVKILARERHFKLPSDLPSDRTESTPLIDANGKMFGFNLNGCNGSTWKYGIILPDLIHEAFANFHNNHHDQDRLVRELTEKHEHYDDREYNQLPDESQLLRPPSGDALTKVEAATKRLLSLGLLTEIPTKFGLTKAT